LESNIENKFAGERNAPIYDYGRHLSILAVPGMYTGNEMKGRLRAKQDIYNEQTYTLEHILSSINTTDHRNDYYRPAGNETAIPCTPIADLPTTFPRSRLIADYLAAATQERADPTTFIDWATGLATSLRERYTAFLAKRREEQATKDAIRNADNIIRKGETIAVYEQSVDRQLVAQHIQHAYRDAHLAEALTCDVAVILAREEALQEELAKLDEMSTLFSIRSEKVIAELREHVPARRMAQTRQTTY
jgi:hypothetical protein